VFTGIVEEVGTVREVRSGAHSAALTIQGQAVFEDLRTGDSVAVNGVCLTVTSRGTDTFTADVMHETLRRSSLGALRPGGRVNLERALPATGRFGGHIVTGHIDGTGTVADVARDGVALWFTIRAESQLLRYVVEKGSVAVDGISLTVASVNAESFRVSVIPHTLAATALAEKKAGGVVNLETDILGKYVEKLLGDGAPKGNITKEFLSQHGY